MPKSVQDLESHRAAEHEIAEFRRFKQLMQEFIEVNAKICHARSAEEAPVSQEKKRQRPRAKKRPAN